MGYSRYGSQVLPDEGAQNTCTRTVQDAYAADSYQDSIIDEIGDCLYGFVSAHTSDIDVLLEIHKLKLDGGSVFDFSVGGMYRDKKRDSFFNEYTFNSATGVKDPQYQGEDWNNYEEILFTPLKYGNISAP